jgi:hypothetical protein
LFGLFEFGLISTPFVDRERFTVNYQVGIAHSASIHKYAASTQSALYYHQDFHQGYGRFRNGVR